MSSQKLHKISRIVKELTASSDGRYNIDGVNLSLAKFLWREPFETFEDLNPADYRIEEVGGSTFLVVTSVEINSLIEALQIVHILDFSASKYETEYDVDINTLKNKFNSLVEDTLNMWEHLMSTGFIHDIKDGQTILPQLGNDELWYMGDGTYKALSLTDFTAIGEHLIEDYVEFQKKLLEILFRNCRENLITTKENGILEIQNLLNSLNLNVENFTGDKKAELQKIVNDFRAELESVAVGNSQTLQGYTPEDFVKTEKTIEDLKLNEKLAIGDVLDLQGYYSPGDGAHHKRKIEAQDDGSGVQLANGLWANILHNGEVNVSWFGVDTKIGFDNAPILNGIFGLVRQNKVSKIKFGSGEFYFYSTINATQLNNNLRDTVIEGCGSNYGDDEGKGRGTVLKLIRRSQIELEDNKIGIELIGSSAIKFRDIGIVGNINSVGISSPEILILQQRDNVNQECKHHTWENVRIMTGYGWDFSKNTWKPRLEINQGYGTIGLYNNAGEDNLYTDCVFYGETPIFMTVTNILGIQGKFCQMLQDTNYGRYSCGRNNFEHCIVNSYNGSAYVIDGVNFLRSVSCYTSTFGNSYAIKNIGLPSRFLSFTGVFEDCVGIYEMGATLNHASYPFHYNLKFNDLVMAAGSKWVSAFKNTTNVRVAVLEFSGNINGMNFYVAENDNSNILENIKVNLFSYDGSKYPFECQDTSVFNLSWTCCGSVSSVNFFNWVKAKTKSTSNLKFSSSASDGVLSGEFGAKFFLENTALGNISNPSFSGSRVSDLNAATNFLSYFDGTTKNKPTFGNGVVITLYSNIDKGRMQIAVGNNGLSKLETRSQNLTTGDWGSWSTVAQLNTPYHATKMQQLGIYDDFVTYMDEQHAYEQMQREIESQRQEAYQLALADNQELTYEDWLSTQPQLMPVIEPQPSQALLEFKKKYLG